MWNIPLQVISILKRYTGEEKPTIKKPKDKRKMFANEFSEVAQKVEKNARWILKPMNFCLNYFGNGEIEITNRGNFKIGRITMQRKGDGGRETAKML
ncbi:MAG: hypothetical protein OHK0038_24330 [Flammeovirgaceae bacterium]